MGELSRRDHFILEMYKIFWQNIARTRVSLWAIIPSYGATVWILCQNQDYFEGFPISSASILVIVVYLISIFFSGVAFNLNMWFVRNIELISRVEYDMLEKTDFDKIIPRFFITKAYATKFFNLEFYCLFAYFFILAGIGLSIGTILKDNIKLLEILIILITFIIGFLIEYKYVSSLSKKYDEFKKKSNLPDK